MDRVLQLRSPDRRSRSDAAGLRRTFAECGPVSASRRAVSGRRSPMRHGAGRCGRSDSRRGARADRLHGTPCRLGAHGCDFSRSATDRIGRAGNPVCRAARDSAEQPATAPAVGRPRGASTVEPGLLSRRRARKQAAIVKAGRRSRVERRPLCRLPFPGLLLRSTPRRRGPGALFPPGRKLQSRKARRERRTDRTGSRVALAPPFADLSQARASARRTAPGLDRASLLVWAMFIAGVGALGLSAAGALESIGPRARRRALGACAQQGSFAPAARRRASKDGSANGIRYRD